MSSRLPEIAKHQFELVIILNIVSLESAGHTLYTHLPPKIEEENDGHMGL